MYTTSERYTILETKYKDKTMENHKLQTKISELEFQFDLKEKEMQSELQTVRSKLLLEFQEEKKKLQEEITNLTIGQHHSSSTLISQLNNTKIDFENINQKYILEKERNAETKNQLIEHMKKAEFLQEQLQNANTTIALLRSRHDQVCFYFYFIEICYVC
jgi:hypothetical protein